MNTFKKALVVAALAFASQANAQVVLSEPSGDLTVGVMPSGVFGSPAGAPYGVGVPGIDYMGTEFVMVDNPVAWYSLETIAGTSTATYANNPFGATVTALPGDTVAVAGTSSLSFLQTLSLTASNQISVTVQLKNTTTESMSGVKWGVGFDPDQGGSGNNNTVNEILGQGTAAAVSAEANGFKITLANTTTAFPTAIGAYIGGDCCTTVSPSSALAGAQGVGFSNSGDYSISLAYDIGTLAAGQVVSFGYNYTITPVPEPEIYAMMAAGLGLMGFVARRRQRNGAVA